MGSVKSVTCF